MLSIESYKKCICIRKVNLLNKVEFESNINLVVLDTIEIFPSRKLAKVQQNLAKNCRMQRKQFISSYTEHGCLCTGPPTPLRRNSTLEDPKPWRRWQDSPTLTGWQ